MKVSRPLDKIFFTADLHISHANIIKYAERPWQTPNGYLDVKAMDESLLERWNDTVPEDGIVFVNGDLTMNLHHSERIIRQMKGDIYLVPGNHDKKKLLKSGLVNVMPALSEIRVADLDAPRNEQLIVLCHYSMRAWNKSHWGSWMLYGHSHHKLPKDMSVKSFDVGIDGEGYDYKPLSYLQVKEMMQNHKQEQINSSM